uniref:Secreted protein n=1 Tax=Salix viminalis TaxID=40686 RepID=A0A6N2K9V2_SALVM
MNIWFSLLLFLLSSSLLSSHTPLFSALLIPASSSIVAVVSVVGLSKIWWLVSGKATKTFVEDSLKDVRSGSALECGSYCHSAWSCESSPCWRYKRSCSR